MVCVQAKGLGVPITVFVHKTGALNDQAVLDRIAAIIRKRARIPGSPVIRRISGLDHAVVGMSRSWIFWMFGSTPVARMVSCWRTGTIWGWPPTFTWKGPISTAVGFNRRCWKVTAPGSRQGRLDPWLRHGGRRQKMSKSLGNIVSPQDVTNRFSRYPETMGRRVRLFDDLRIGAEILKRHADVYRRLRLLLRYVLGNLNGFQVRKAAGKRNAGIGTLGARSFEGHGR